MMKTAAWVGIGFVAMALWSAAGARSGATHLFPDAAVITVTFVALRREPIPTAAAAFILGYFSGRQALAPVGVHEAALVLCAAGVYMTSGRLAGSGALFFGGIAAATQIVYHGTLFLLAYLAAGNAGFASLWAALLLPGALVTGVVAVLSYPLMIRVERRLVPEGHEELSWS
ncbi:MAG: hypothetical protein HYZ27_11030 [Deltaproteobacteria bacterium]|nr:hypothetical protein [Deltaproteobacteria bacterium]